MLEERPSTRGQSGMDRTRANDPSCEGSNFRGEEKWTRYDNEERGRASHGRESKSSELGDSIV